MWRKIVTITIVTITIATRFKNDDVILKNDDIIVVVRTVAMATEIVIAIVMTDIVVFHLLLPYIITF